MSVGCSTTRHGNAVPETPSSASNAQDLDGHLLLSPAEVDAAMGATDMTPGRTQDTFVDDSQSTDPARCLAVSSMGQTQVYAHSKWTAVRMQSLHEPGEDFQHLAHQAVVSFPTTVDATAFITASIDTWASCANGQYTYRAAGEAPVTWTVGHITNANGLLVATLTQQDGDGWTCQRALTAAANVAVDILTCSYQPTDQAAVTMARQIADKITGQ
jgi:hypothetical protein